MMKNKKGIVFGLINQSSIAYAIAEELYAHGAEMLFTYPSEQIKKKMEPFAKMFGSDDVYYCNVLEDESIDDLFSKANEKFNGQIDFIVHAIAFANKNDLRGEYLDVSLENFLTAMHVSCYSLTAIVKRAKDMMKISGGSILTLTYHGASKVIPNYNVMGVCKAALECSVRYLAEDLGKYNIRINALSAGPIKTLAASGITDFSQILKWNKYNSPLRRNITLKDISKSALYILSDLSSGTTGTVLYVDGGYHIIGMCTVDAPIEYKTDINRSVE